MSNFYLCSCFILTLLVVGRLTAEYCESPVVVADPIQLTDISQIKHVFPGQLIDKPLLETGIKSQPAKCQVLMFIGVDCPIANFYLPEWERIKQDYAAKGFQFLCVHELADVIEAKAIKHQADFKISSPVILDPERKLMKLTGVKVLSEVVVLDDAGYLLYRGRLNDQYIAPGKKRVSPTSHDLRAALADIVEKGYATQPRTEAVGCYLEKNK